MELTRRDAMAALAAASAGSVAGCAALPVSPNATDASESSTDDASIESDTATKSDALSTSEGAGDESSIDEHDSATLVALAAVVYPTDLAGIEAFVRTYTSGRLDGDQGYARGVTEAIEALDAYAREFHDARYACLSPETRADVIDHMSVDVAEPDPDGTAAERVRYYLVNELLYALYTSPTGAKLAGLENPPGHPGGRQSYQESPSE